MRGLPLPPDNVVHFNIECAVSEALYSFGFWLLVNDVAAGGLPYLDALGASFVLEVGPAIEALQSADASLSTCRLTVVRPTPLVFTSIFPDVHGAGPNRLAGTTALGVYLLSSSGGRGSGSRLRIPGIRDDALAGPTALSFSGRARLVAVCDAFVTWVASISDPLGGQPVLGTVQRSKSGAPLPVALFDPATGVLPSDRVEVLSRRRGKPGRVSPLLP